jgi:hypothetical protein
MDTAQEITRRRLLTGAYTEIGNSGISLRPMWIGLPVLPSRVMSNSTNESAGELSSFEAKARAHETFLISAVLALTALAYASTLRFDFTLDDSWQIVNNQWVQSWRFVPGYFYGHVWPHLGSNPPQNYYRPLNFVWFQIVHTFFGLNSAGWHAAAILLHVFVTFLGYLAVRRISGRVLVSIAAALTFGIHPMRHEVVGWVSGTTESFWSVFFLLAFLAYLESRKGHRWAWMGISYLFYVTALFSKETAIVFPAIIFAHSWIYDTESHQSLVKGFWSASRPAFACVPIAIGYLAVRISMLRAFWHPKISVSLTSLALSLPSVTFFYVRQWLVPNEASSFYPIILQRHFSLPWVLLPLLGLIATAVLLWLVRDSLGWREVLFATVWMAVLIAPTLDLATFPDGDFVHDRYFYLPSLGASLLLGLALEKLATGPAMFGLPKRWLAAAAVLLVLLSYSTVDALSYWRNDYELLNHAALFSPNDPIVKNLFSVNLAMLGREAYLQGDWAAAESYLLRAKSIDPLSADNYLQLGMVDLNTKQARKAEENFRAALQLRPNEPMFHFALGVALTQQQKCSEARPQFVDTLDLKPGFQGAQAQLDACNAALRAEGARAGHSFARP